MNDKIYISYGTLISALGIGIAKNFRALNLNFSGIKKVENVGYQNENLYLGKIDALDKGKRTSRFDQLLRISIRDLYKRYRPEVFANPKTLFIVSSTKGNIDDLSTDIFASTRRIIAEFTQNPNEVVVVCNACISGVVAVNVAADYLRFSDFETVVVIGIDVLSDFVMFGFQSLFALADAPARPFDKYRNGLSLGEACAIVVLTQSYASIKNRRFAVEYIAGSSANDAHHISAPSPMGEGLRLSIQKTLKGANLSASDIDFVSAHGTGTIYNDEMESVAFHRSKLHQVPTNSFKGFFGHTLGASGVAELIACMLSIEHRILFQSKGFRFLGTKKRLNIVRKSTPAKIQTVLKTASGFGGGNASLIIQKLATKR